MLSRKQRRYGAIAITVPYRVRGQVDGKDSGTHLGEYITVNEQVLSGRHLGTAGTTACRAYADNVPEMQPKLSGFETTQLTQCQRDNIQLC